MRLVAASLCPRSAEGPCAPGTPPRLVRALLRGGPRGRIRVPPSRPNTRPEASPLYTVAWKGRDTYLAPNTKRLKRLSNLLNVAELVRGPRQSAVGCRGRWGNSSHCISPPRFNLPLPPSPHASWRSRAAASPDLPRSGSAGNAGKGRDFRFSACSRRWVTRHLAEPLPHQKETRSALLDCDLVSCGSPSLRCLS